MKSFISQLKSLMSDSTMISICIWSKAALGRHSVLCYLLAMPSCCKQRQISSVSWMLDWSCIYKLWLTSYAQTKPELQQKLHWRAPSQDFWSKGSSILFDMEETQSIGGKTIRLQKVFGTLIAAGILLETWREIQGLKSKKAVQTPKRI